MRAHIGSILPEVTLNSNGRLNRKRCHKKKGGKEYGHGQPRELPKE